MNANALLKKIQRAILTKGLIVKINTAQFFSRDMQRYITIWILSTPTLQNTRNGWRERDYEILRSASAVEVTKCLAEIFEQIKGWKK